MVVSVCVSTCMCSMPGRGNSMHTFKGQKNSLGVSQNDHSSLSSEQKAQSGERRSSGEFICHAKEMPCHLKGTCGMRTRIQVTSAWPWPVHGSLLLAEQPQMHLHPITVSLWEGFSLAGPDGNLFLRFISKASQELSI